MQITEKSKLNIYSGVIEMIKGEYFINSIELSRNTSKLAQSEDQDCVVRAFMVALDIPYDQAHAWVKKELHRKNNRGTMMNAFSKNIIGKTKNGKKINFIGAHPSKNMRFSVGSTKVLANKQYKKPTGYTLKSFMENNPVGRFVLIVQGHAVAIVNGVLYANTGENAVGLYRSVWMGFEIK